MKKKATTITKAIARLMSDGKPRASAEIMAALGLTNAQVLTALTCLRSHRRVANQPVLHKITPAGKAYARKENVPAARRVAVSRERVKKREQADAAKVAAELETVVGRALLSRPALQMAWGSANA